MSQNVQSLFAGAQAGGAIGAAAAQVLAIPDLGAQIQAGLGLAIDDLTTSSEVLLVSLLIDDSGSIDAAGNEQVVRDGVNFIVDSLKKSKQGQGDSILVSIRYLNGTVLVPYVTLDQVPKLDTSNYQANGGTPLYQQSIVICGQATAKVQEFADNGCMARGVTALISDGADQHSPRGQRAPEVQKVISDMRKTESHIVIGVGIDDGSTDFKKVYAEMGIDPKHILTPGNTQSEIRKAFAVISQSAVRASQGAQGFSQTAGAGFTN